MNNTNNNILLLVDYSGVLANRELKNDLIWKTWAKLCNLPFDECDYPKIIEGASKEDAIKYILEYKNIKVNDFDYLVKKLYEAINIVKEKYPQLFENKLMPGLKEFLEFVEKNKLKMVIVSSSSKESINNFLKSVNPNIDIEVFATYEIIKEKGFRNKPYPDVYIEALKKYKYNNVYIIEDSLQTIKFIKRDIPNVKVIGVIHDVNKCVEDEIRKYADYIIYSLDEIPNIIFHETHK